jgi:hypothetical protein
MGGEVGKIVTVSGSVRDFWKMLVFPTTLQCHLLVTPDRFECCMNVDTKGRTIIFIQLIIQ